MIKMSKKKLKMVGTPSDCAITSNGIDRISQLNDDILHHILSNMDIVDVVRLSVLSRRWKSLWMTIPNLKINVGRLRTQQKFPLTGPSTEFARVINWVLMCQGSTQLNRFCLESPHWLDEKDVVMWVRVAALRNVKKLELLLVERESEEFELPNCLFTCESLRVLKLNLPFTILKMPNSSKFKQLTSLYLELVEFKDDDLTRRLFSHCSFLKELSLIEFLVTDLKVLDISSSSLTRLTLETYDCYGDEYYSVHKCELKISCPCLVSITYKGGTFRSYNFDNISSLDTTSIDMFPDHRDCPNGEVGQQACKFLKQLKVIRVLRIVDQTLRYLGGAVKDLQCFATKFQRLESLDLSVSPDGRCTQAMFLLLNHCPYLESLTVVSQLWSANIEQNESWQLDDEANANWGYRLKSVRWFKFGGEEHELRFVKFMLRTGLVLETFKIVWQKYDQESQAAHEKVLKFPKASSRVKVTSF